jgi:hypothetical protein
VETGYLTVVIDDLPASVIKTTSQEEAISVTMWLREAPAAPLALKRTGRRKLKNCGGMVRCRASSPREIAEFEEKNIDWQGVILLGVLL